MIGNVAKNNMYFKEKLVEIVIIIIFKGHVGSRGGCGGHLRHYVHFRLVLMK